MKPSDKKLPIDTKPDSEFIAQQLRRPSGEFAPKVGSMMNEVNKPLYDLVFDVMKVQKNDRILEIGFGTGKFFDELFSKEPALHISAIDFSEEMVEEAKKYNQEKIAAGKLEIKSGRSA